MRINGRELMTKMLELGIDINRYAWCTLRKAVPDLEKHQREIEIMKILLENGPNPNCRNWFGQTPLHVAVSCGAPLDIVQFLVMKGADPLVLDQKGKTVLHYVRKGVMEDSSVEIIEFLLQNGCNLSKGDIYGETLLHGMFNIENICCILANRAVVNVQDCAGSTPLHETVTHNRLSHISKCLLDNKADPDIADKHGRTPLHEASSRGSLANVRHLLDVGCKVNAQNDEGRTPLHEDVAFDHLPAAAKCLLEHSPDLDLVDIEGSTVLHLAVNHGSIEKVDLFLRHGCSVNAKDKDGRTALHLAMCGEPIEDYLCQCTVCYNMLKIAAQLLDHSADINITDNRGTNALLMLTTIITGICSKEYNPYMKNQLEPACNLFKELVNRNSDLYCTDRRGNTPLLLLGTNMANVFLWGISQLIIQLIDHSADIGLYNKDGQSFYSLFKEFSKNKSSSYNETIGEIEAVLKVPSLQCLSLHVAYPLRERIRLLSHVPNLVSRYLNLQDLIV